MIIDEVKNIKNIYEFKKMIAGFVIYARMYLRSLLIPLPICCEEGGGIVRNSTKVLIWGRVK